MIATFPPSHSMPTLPISRSASRNDNTAGRPLPMIPRRALSSTKLTVATPQQKISSPAIVVQQATPPDEDIGIPRLAVSSSSPPLPPSNSKQVESSSGSDSDPDTPSTLRPRRIRGIRSISTGNPAVDNSPTVVHAARKSCVIRPRIPAPSPEVASAMRSAPPRPIIRKKSGQLVKSSLKSSKPSSRGSLSVVTGQGTSKSEPSTPCFPKNVHFDARLEHVKLFLSEQRPLAVSRDGSPTDETDSDFPSFIFGSSDPQHSKSTNAKKELRMQVVNMPPCINPDADVALLVMELGPDGTSISGKVRVKNISFEKWTAIRFTFDAWQTTSEVAGKYVESVGDFDVFGFTIRLNDLLARIEGKTMILAIRYNVAGREFWDNNGGHNYLAAFSKTVPSVKAKPRSSSSGSESDNVNGSDLRQRLEKVVKERDDGASPIALRASEPSSSSLESLTSRYDFGASLKQAWNSELGHTRTKSGPSGSLNASFGHANTKTYSRGSLSSIPWPTSPENKPALALGSPRDLEGSSDPFLPAPIPDDLGDKPFPVLSPKQDHGIRHHQRGYFDLSFPPTVRRTPPGTPEIRLEHSPAMSPGGRHYSFPPVVESPSVVYFGRLPVSSADSDLSTPSVASPSDGSSTSSSSTSPTTQFMAALNSGLGPVQTASPTTSYNEFLNQFCFYTGSDTGLSLPTTPQRTGSMSMLEDLLSHSPVVDSDSSFSRKTPSPPETRDDSAIRSGSSTPRPFSRSPSLVSS